jgi:hypothetical protein
MNKIENLNDIKVIKALRAEYQEAINAISAKYGLKGEMGRITYNANEMRCKLTVLLPAQKGPLTPKTPRKAGDGLSAPITSTSSYIGRSFKLRNSVYTVTHMKSPGVFLAENQNGRIFRIKAEQLKSMQAI